jgi:ureidoglycolate lyase
MIALNEPVSFAVLIHENGVADEDCQEVYIKPGIPIEFNPHQSPSRMARL